VPHPPTPAPQMLVFPRHCALYKFTYLLTYRQTDDMRSQDRALHYSASRGNDGKVGENTLRLTEETDKSLIT